MTGEQLQADIFMGPTYYMRLKHMVKDKINYRATGPRTQLTRQTVQGRANDGGLRIGEMERDSMLGHGASFFLKDSMMERADKYYMAICNQTGMVAVYNPSRNLFLSPMSDGPLTFAGNSLPDLRIQTISRYGRDFSVIAIPYSMKLLIQELQTINVAMRIITDKNIGYIESLLGKKTVVLPFQTPPPPPMLGGALTNEEADEDEKIVAVADDADADDADDADDTDNADELDILDIDQYPPPDKATKDLQQMKQHLEAEELNLDNFVPETHPTFYENAEVVYRGDIQKPNRIWKIKSTDPSFLTITTDDTEGFDTPQKCIRVVRPEEVILASDCYMHPPMGISFEQQMQQLQTVPSVPMMMMGQPQPTSPFINVSPNFYLPDHHSPSTTTTHRPTTAEPDPIIETWDNSPDFSKNLVVTKKDS
jgi:hypothetical protein